MANVYSTSFLILQGGANGSVMCPEGYRAVLRCITCFSSSLVEPEYGHVLSVNGNATIWQGSAPIPQIDGQYSSVILLLHYVFETGDGIYTQNSSNIDMTLSGFLLTLP